MVENGRYSEVKNKKLWLSRRPWLNIVKFKRLKINQLLSHK